MCKHHVPLQVLLEGIQHEHVQLLTTDVQLEHVQEKAYSSRKGMQDELGQISDKRCTAQVYY
jgi:hypothetical protein